MVVKMLTKGNILDERGNLIESGMSFEDLKVYNKERIPKYLKSRVKEWDYYTFQNDKIGFLLTIANNTYMSYISCSFVNLETASYVTKTYINVANPKKFILPTSAFKGNIQILDKKYFLKVEKTPKSTKILAKLTHFVKNMNILLNLEVTPNKLENGIFILHPFKNKHHFYYNYKENLLNAKGTVTLGGNITKFEGYGSYDFGRGIWPYKTEWFWISATKVCAKNSLSLNLGCGFGICDENENFIIYNNQKFKLPDIQIEIPYDEKHKIKYLDEWKIISADGSINLTFKPILNRKDTTHAIILYSKQNQVFGEFYGEIKTTTSTIEIEKVSGFIEHFNNKW